MSSFISLLRAAAGLAVGFGTASVLYSIIPGFADMSALAFLVLVAWTYGVGLGVARLLDWKKHTSLLHDAIVLVVLCVAAVFSLWVLGNLVPANI